VQFLGRVIRFLFWFFLVTWLGRKLLGWFSKPREQGRQYQPASAEPLRLVRDPVCGMHVSSKIAITLLQAGQEIHFCSMQCREHFLNSRSQAAGA
jgi:YHS domain-containing protein